MKIDLEFISFVEQPFDQKWFLKIAKKTFDEIAIKNLENKVVTISLAIVDDNEICRQNSSLRGKKTVTDVLSVGDYSDDNKITEEISKDIFLGEIILGFNFIKESAEIDNKKIEYELAYVFSHGILHLLGYKHGDEMFSVQEKVCDHFDF